MVGPEADEGARVMGSKRPWKKWAWVKRVERNSGDVEFVTMLKPQTMGYDSTHTERDRFQSLTEAEASLDEWYAEWWPKQVKRTRRA